MKDKHAKTTASSTRAGLGSASSSGFGSASSVISYLAEQPDLSYLSDPNVAVHFKNLSKKDSTTKSKALDELHAYLTTQHDAQATLEDSFIEAWTKVFPRLSIDVSRRVRQSSFALQKHVSKASGKRMARHMPTIAPMWLAGCHDGDKGVMRAAHDGLQSMFSSPEKQKNLRKAYQAQILAFATEVVETETKDSLSDPKNTTTEDAETVYNRVVSSSLNSVSETMQFLDSDDLEMQASTYQTLLGSRRLLDLLAQGDVSARRAIFTLIRNHFLNLPNQAVHDVNRIANALLSKRTSRHQTGTAALYVEILTLLTSHEHQFWTTDKTLEVLQNTGKHGSLGGNAQFWVNFAQLFEVMPDGPLPRNCDDTAKVLEAIKTGIARKDEQVANQPAAFRCYFKALERLCDNLVPEEKQKIALIWAMPIVRQSIRLTSETSPWPLSDRHALQIAGDALQIEIVQGGAEHEWHKIVDHVLQDLQTSLPAQAKDFDRSQTEVEKEGMRLFTLQSRVAAGQVSEKLQSAFGEAAVAIVKESIGLLKSRAGKPYGAAGCIASAVEHQSIEQDPSADELDLVLDEFLENVLPTLLFTPSGPRLIKVLSLQSRSKTFKASWSASLEAILDHPDSLEKGEVLLSLLKTAHLPKQVEEIHANEALQHCLTTLVSRALQTKEGGTTLDKVFARDQAAVLSDRSVDHLISSFVDQLTSDETLSSSLEALRQLMRRNADLLKGYVASDKGTLLLQNLLRTQELSDEDVSLSATELLSALDSSTISGSSDTSEAQVIKVLEKSLYDADQDSLGVDTLVQLALRHLTSSPSPDTLAKVLPDANKWATALEPFLTVAPPESFAVTDELGGFIALTSTAKKPNDSYQPPPVDAYGQTPLLRISVYAAQLLLKASELKLGPLEMPDDSSHALFRNLSLTAAVGNDRLSFQGANPLWDGEILDDEVTDFVSNARRLMQTLVDVSPSSSGPISMLADAASSMTPSALFHAREWARAQSQAVEESGWRAENTSQVEARFTQLKKEDSDSIRLAAFLAAYQTPLAGSAVLLRFMNELIATLTGLDATAQPHVAHSQAATLALISRLYGPALQSVAKQRLIFLVKHIVPWLSQALPESLKAEVLKALTSILPHMADVYGEDWEKTLDFFATTWADAGPLNETSAGSATIALWHSSLKLSATLRNLTQDTESNDDLREAWQEKLDDLAHGLANLLKQSGHLSDEANLPLRATNEVLARHIKAVPAQKLGDLSGLYALLDTQSREVQQTAFDILHRQIPQEQEEISVNVALEKTVARLPEKLLSLVASTPDPDLYEDLVFDRSMPSSLFTYLSGWLLVFDHFKKASYKVRSDYVAHIKEQAVHTALLDMIFASLGHANSKPIDPSKFDATFYSFNVESDPKRDVQWLLIHLYYLCLSRLPSLTKAWWIDCRSRQIRAHVEPWTEKHFSPLVIADALQATAEWAKQQDANADDALIIKANERTKEVTASKEVDDQLLTIAIRLPLNFPLGPVSVEGVNRVAVEEKKWRSWLLNTQGVITFSDNSIADGLITFRRNVSGQLKGQTECAICYSIVSQDKQLPTKKCKTCKNMFHGSCLYKWFKSSNSSSCPLCRTAFNYA